jgi:PAS domain S-box-containing protein
MPRRTDYKRASAPRKDVEKGLRENFESYQALFHATFDAVWDWDLITDTVWWNDGITGLFGYPREAVGSDANWWVEHIHPEERERVVTSIYAVIDGSETFWRSKYRYQCADFSYAVVVDRGYVIRDVTRKPLRMIGAMDDVTDRGRAGEELHLAEQRFRVAAESISDVIYDWDVATNRVDWFGDIDRLLGYDPGAFPRMRDAWSQRLHPEDHDRVMARLERCLETGDAFDGEYRIACKDGGYRVWCDNGRAVFDRNGKPWRWFGAIADITDRKRAEAERERLLKQLQEERRRLQASQAKLQEKVAELERFHDVVVGRELKMIELERELARLKAEPSDPSAAGR